MERAFWDTLLDHLPRGALQELNDKMELVQVAITIGTVLRVLGVQRSQGLKIDAVHIPSVHALPKLLTYRAPSVRGPDERPFAYEDEASPCKNEVDRSEEELGQFEGPGPSKREEEPVQREEKYGLPEEQLARAGG